MQVALQVSDSTLETLMFSAKESGLTLGELLQSCLATGINSALDTYWQKFETKGEQ